MTRPLALTTRIAAGAGEADGAGLTAFDGLGVGEQAAAIDARARARAAQTFVSLP